MCKWKQYGFEGGGGPCYVCICSSSERYVPSHLVKFVWIIDFYFGFIFSIVFSFATKADSS